MAVSVAQRVRVLLALTLAAACARTSDRSTTGATTAPLIVIGLDGADPNISAADDHYDFFTDGVNLDKITNDGPLSNDRRHQFKVSGTWITPVKLEVGASAFYRSGTPLTRYGYSDAYGRYEFFLENRGSEGRNPSNYEVDLHLGYPLQAGRAKFNFLLDIFSLINSQKAIVLDQRWGFQEADNGSNSPANSVTEKRYYAPRRRRSVSEFASRSSEFTGTAWGAVDRPPPAFRIAATSRILVPALVDSTASVKAASICPWVTRPSRCAVWRHPGIKRAIA